MNIDLASKYDLKPGTWLFTCDMKPKQFESYDEPRNPKDYSVDWNKMTPLEKMQFQYDGYKTIGGAYHSIKNCGCKPISEAYAKWFLENKIDEIFKVYEDKENRWELYENEVKRLCQEAGIEYEGI